MMLRVEKKILSIGILKKERKLEVKCLSNIMGALNN